MVASAVQTAHDQLGLARGPRNASVVAPFRIRLGPYVFRVLLVPRSKMLDRRRTACVDFERQTFLIRADQASLPSCLLRGFLTCLLGAIHYCSGLRADTDDEEVFTHSAASGFVQFVLDNPEAWVWMNGLLDRWLGHAESFARLASLPPASLKGMPRTLRMGGQTVRMRLVPKRHTERHGVWGWLDTGREELVVGRHLVGTHFAVIMLHEIWHLLHNSAGLDDGARFYAYRRLQPRLLMRFVRTNRQAWHWLVRLLGALRQAQAQRAADIRAALRG